MCVVSNVSDHYRGLWPNPYTITITQEQWEEYQRLKRNAFEIDKLTKQPNCAKPDIDEWEKKIEDFLKKNLLK